MADGRYGMAWAREQEGLDWRRRGKTGREKEGLSSDECDAPEFKI